MIYMERTITIKNGNASIDEPVYLYKGDKNIEIRFFVENNPFKSRNSLTVNYGQLIIKREKAPDIFSEVTKLSGGRIIFVITGEMIDELDELGNYTFQIRLFNEDKTSRGTLPPVEAGICIVKPLCEEPIDPPKVYINPDFYEIRTKGGTDYSYLFSNSTAEKIPDFSTWDTSTANNMSHMFYSCYNLTTLDLSNLDTSNVNNMSHMFWNCYNLTSLDVSNFNTSNVTNMSDMFYGCESLVELDLSTWDTSKVTNMSYMFYGCESLESLNLSNFNVDELDYRYAIFDLDDCENLHTLRLDNCSRKSIINIISLIVFPNNTITDSEGNIIPRKIYVKEANVEGLTPQNNWVFEFID